MNEITIAINYDNNNPTISGRELHEALGIKTQYSIWFTRMCEYGFAENTDYVAVNQKRLTAQGNETTFTDHALTIDMAELSAPSVDSLYEKIDILERRAQTAAASALECASQRFGDLSKRALAQSPENRLALTGQRLEMLSQHSKAAFERIR